MKTNQRTKLLESIIYKNFRGIALTKTEKKLEDEIVEIKDYGKVLK